MHCPFCRHPDSRVVDSREAEEGTAIRRRRVCPSCEKRFTTLETAALVVRKRSGVAEPFSRAKVLVGVRKACQGRPVDDDQLALLAQRVEEAVRALGTAEVPAHEVGLAVLEPLRDLDEVAYLRFASVYRGFESLHDFEAEITRLRAGGAGRPGAGTDAAPPPVQTDPAAPPGPQGSPGAAPDHGVGRPATAPVARGGLHADTQTLTMTKTQEESA